MGLSSVGLSTKAKKKRTVGFMGVGFKACYKRYSEVSISDGLFSFQFSKTSSDEGYSWVMQPKWMEDSSSSNRSSSSTTTSTSTRCCFDLKRCTGGSGAPLRDLSYLPPTAPPLLGRTAMARIYDAALEESKVKNKDKSKRSKRRA